MFKKLTAILLSAFIVVLSVPAVRSRATDITVANTFADICNGYTSDDFLSTSNYDNYFMKNSTSNNDLGIKYSVYEDIFCNNSNANFGSTMWTLLKNDIDNNMQNIGNTYFPDKQGFRLSYFRYNPGNYSVAYFNCIVVGSDDLAIVQNTICSKSDFVFYTVKYNDQGGAFNGSFKFVSESTSGNKPTLDNGIYKYVLMPETSNIRFLYSEMPLYLTYQYNSNYSDLKYLANTPYNYDDVDSVYNSINNDSTGFVIDRRTKKMINGSSGGNNPTIDNNLGVIGGSFDCLLSSDSLNNQKFLVVYDLNDYTKQIKNTINLKLNYQFFCDGQYQNNNFTFDGNFVDSVGYPDSYNVNYSNYVTIDMNKVFNNIYGSDLIASDFGLDTIFMIGNQVNFNQKFYTANEFINSIMKIGGFSLSTRKNVDYYNNRSFWENVGDSVIDFLNQGFTEKSLQFNYNTSKDTVFNDCYLLVTMYLENEQNNTCSDSYIYKYNYLDGTVSNVGGFEDDSVFSGNYPTTNSGSASYPSNNTGYGGSAYGGSAYGGSGGSASASTGDIYVYPGMTSLPYLLVDIPEDEWINKTPNLKTILTDFKDALSEVKDNSILNVMSETYNYLPVPVWQYFTYGVGILIAIGIWRAITRR